ncbi:MAG: DUF1905 domain-containing protein [Planctomycetota bacterium]
MGLDRFRAWILDGHKGAAVEVPFDPADRWGTRAQALRPGRRGHAAAAEIGGVAFESHVVARSSRHWLLVPATVLARAGAKVGDAVEVRLGPQDAPARASATRTRRTPPE